MTVVRGVGGWGKRRSDGETKRGPFSATSALLGVLRVLLPRLPIRMRISKRRRWALVVGGLAVAGVVGAGLWAYFAFAWIFFVKPGDGGPNLALTITHVAGASGGGDGAPGFADGVGEAARLNKPIRLALATDGSIIFADIKNHAIRRVDAEDRVTTLAGGGGPEKKGHKDGPASEAMLNSPHGVAVRHDGVIAVAEAGNNTIRLLTPVSTPTSPPTSSDGPVTYTVSTLAGSPTEKGMRDGPVEQALFNAPHAVAWGPEGELYIADIGNARLRMIEGGVGGVGGVCSTIAGTGRRGAADGGIDVGTLNFPMDFALAADGSLWIADAGSLTIRRWSREEGLTTPFPGLQLAMPHGITIVTGGQVPGEVIVAELNGQRVLGFDPASGAVRTLCGTTEKGIGEGRLNRPAAVLAVGRTVWIADLGNHRIATVELAE